MPISLLVADTHRLFAEALGDALERFPEFSVLREFPTTGPEAVNAAYRLAPDVALIDYWMLETEGPATTRRILQEVPDCKVLLLSGFHGRDQIEMTLDSGAVGLLPKASTVETVAEAVRRAAAGDRPVFAEQLQGLVRTLDNRTAQILDISRRFEQLTPRETEVLRHFSQGLTREEVASRLFIGEATVKAHVRNLLRKLGARSTSEAVAMAVRCGWIQM